MTELAVDVLRAEVREKYREVADDPNRPFHFHTGRALAARLGYELDAVDAPPDRAVEVLRRRRQPGKPVPPEALRDIDLWTGGAAGGLPRAGWQRMLEEPGFVDGQIGEAADTFGGAGGEEKRGRTRCTATRSSPARPTEQQTDRRGRRRRVPARTPPRS